MMPHYKDADCCYNCVYSIYDDYHTAWYCNSAKDFPREGKESWYMADHNGWSDQHRVSEHGVCDDFWKEELL